MTFDLVRISRTKDDRGNDVYRSFVQSDGRAGTRLFKDREEMIETVRQILAKQERDGFPPAKYLFDWIETGSFQFSGRSALDLTTEQAKSLGWV